MTPKQMIKRTVESTNPLRVSVAELYGAQDILWNEQSESLREGKCPTCGANVTHDVDRDMWVYFRCEKNPVFHEFRRAFSFLMSD